MLQNPQLAQSYILLNILRKQRDRILHKTSSLPTLHTQVSKLEYSYMEKQKQYQDNAMKRKEKIKELEECMEKKVGQRKNVLENAEGCMNVLRINLGKMKDIKMQIGKERRQSEQLQKQQQIITQKLKQLDKKLIHQKDSLQKQKSQLSTLLQQHQIGTHHLSNILTHYTNIRNTSLQTLTRTTSLHSTLSILQQKIQSQQSTYCTIQTSLLHTKQSQVNLEMEIQERMEKCDRLGRKIGMMEMEGRGLEGEVGVLEGRIGGLEGKLEEKLSESDKYSGEIVVMGAQAGVLQRQSKLTQHRIQCIKILQKRLYACGDRLRSSRRGKNLIQNQSLNTNSRSRYGIMSRISKDPQLQSSLQQKSHIINIPYQNVTQLKQSQVERNKQRYKQ